MTNDTSSVAHPPHHPPPKLQPSLFRRSGTFPWAKLGPLPLLFGLVSDPLSGVVVCAKDLLAYKFLRNILDSTWKVSPWLPFLNPSTSFPLSIWFCPLCSLFVCISRGTFWLWVILCAKFRWLWTVQTFCVLHLYRCSESGLFPLHILADCCMGAVWLCVRVCGEDWWTRIFSMDSFSL